MSFCDDATLACLTALRSRPWPPSSGELQLLLRAAELTGDSRDGSARAPARHAGPDRPRMSLPR